MELLIVIVVVFFGIATIEIIHELMNKSKEIEKSNVPTCPPHKWAYDHKGQMICNKCKYIIIEE